MSVWKTYGVGSAAYPTSWRRYEYDGLNVLRVDEKYDTAGETLDTNDPWRTIEVNTHKPGSLGALIGKRVYQYSDAADSSPNSSNDYTYTYDALGNVQVVYKASGTVGQEAYFFTQDAFGNELSGDANIPASNRTNLLGGVTWATARTAGITEHQTGKIQSAFSGLQYFWARWYDPLVGRFVGRDPVAEVGGNIYGMAENNPMRYADPSGTCVSCGGGSTQENDPTPAPPKPSPGDETPPNIQTNGCTDDQKKKLQNAGELLWNKIVKERCMEGSEYRSCVLDRMKNAKVICGGLWCCLNNCAGYQRLWYDNIHVCERGFNEMESGSKLDFTLLHEWLHSCGCDHPSAFCGVIGREEPNLGCNGKETKPCYPDGGLP